MQEMFYVLLEIKMKFYEDGSAKYRVFCPFMRAGIPSGAQTGYLAHEKTAGGRSARLPAAGKKPVKFPFPARTDS
jgi:hypothetical protein